MSGGDYSQFEPVIIALWHGQHLLTPAYYPGGRPLVAMVSRSADAELNALMIEKFGIEAVRGSGGRESSKRRDKGGAKALIALKKSLATGKNVAMIADIPHGTPRDAGLGIVLLARLSGRADSAPRHRYQPPQGAGEELGQDHDQPAVRPLPRSCLERRCSFRPMPTRLRWKRKRQEVTAALNAATAEAYRLVDGSK